MSKTINKTNPIPQLKGYVIYDKITGKYSLPIFQLNEVLMLRYFNSITNQPNAMTEATDYELYFIGLYDDLTGLFSPVKKPTFIAKGEQNDNVK